MLALRLPEEIEIRLDALAKATGRAKSCYAREAILTHLEDMEDAYLAEQVYLKFKAGGEKGVPLEDVMREYALDGYLRLTMSPTAKILPGFLAQSSALLFL